MCIRCDLGLPESITHGELMNKQYENLETMARLVVLNNTYLAEITTNIISLE